MEIIEFIKERKLEENKMSYTVENLEKSMAKITITVDADAFEEAMVKSYNKNKKNISIKWKLSNLLRKENWRKTK